jgi:hypothetical protein
LERRVLTLEPGSIDAKCDDANQNRCCQAKKNSHVAAFAMEAASDKIA